jgi:DNA-directed RNA polymerase sigma subunit (sigma70/sigma32)
MSASVGLVRSWKLRDLRLRRWAEAHEEGDLILREGIRFSTVAPEHAAEVLADAQAGDIRSQSMLLRIHAGLVEMWVRYVWAAYRSKARGFDIGDLRQVARMGLLRALARYDRRRAKFSTYASWWIFHHLRRFIENNALPFPGFRAVAAHASENRSQMLCGH